MFQPMEARGKIPAGALHRVVETLFFCALFALPWLNQAHVATILLLLTGGLLLLTGQTQINYTAYKKQLPALALGAYYLLQILTCFKYKGGSNGVEIEQKVALVGIPLLLFVITVNYPNIWQTGMLGFIWGNTVAVMWCIVSAVSQYRQLHSTDVFFYHQFSSAIGMNAIYFSLYLLVCIGFLVLNKSLPGKYLVGLLGTFLYANLLLLDSKIAIIMGSLFLFVLLFRSVKTKLQKIALLAIAVAIYAVLTITVNPIQKRFADVNAVNYSSALTADNFSGYPFDGLSIRLVLWRLGNEVVSEKKAWLTGDGGEHYHDDLDEKMVAYQLYTGNKKLGDTGYLDYNMHNQYMESYLQFGFLGLGLLLLVIVYVLYNAIRHKQAMLVYAMVLFIVFFLTESVLETQSGLLLFTIIISGEWIQLQKKKSGPAI